MLLFHMQIVRLVKLHHDSYYNLHSNITLLVCILYLISVHFMFKLNYKVLPRLCPQLLQGSVMFARGCDMSTLGGLGGGFGFFHPLQVHPSD